MDPKAVQLPDNPQLVLKGKGDILSLGAIPERCIVYLNLFHRIIYCYCPSNSKALCSALTASSAYFASITQDILMSEVLIIMMLIPSFDRTENILTATPEWDLIPTPTTETLAISSLTSNSLAPMSLTTPRIISMVFLTSGRGTVKEMSVRDSWLTFWMIISTTIFSSSTTPNIFSAIPGLSGTPIIV